MMHIGDPVHQMRTQPERENRGCTFQRRTTPSGGTDKVLQYLVTLGSHTDTFPVATFQLLGVVGCQPQFEELAQGTAQEIV